MNPSNLALASNLIKPEYIQQAAEARKQLEKLVTTLLSNRRMPEDAWDEQSIISFVAELSSMDSNNFVENVGAGEREGRIFSSLVRQRNFGFAHGVGRSGELSAQQPKAAGSSLMYKLTNVMAMDAIHAVGITRAKECFVAPLATGMALSLCLSAWRLSRPSARFVLWPRIDQKTCFKCILAAGLIPIVIENILDGAQGNVLRTDLETLEKIASERSHEILAVLSTSSCFAPRIPDDLEGIAKICKKYDLYHLVNNAYGLQTTKACHMINMALDIRLDAFVQSTDKNFMVPVGGSIIASSSSDTLEAISKTYPGRASSSPIVDLFITLLSMGRTGYLDLLKNRKLVYDYFKQRLKALAEAYGERIVETSKNQISIAMTLDTFSTDSDHSHPSSSVASSSKEASSSLPNTELKAEKSQKNQTFIGAMLFNSCTSGIRVVVPKKKERINGYDFVGFGSHHAAYPSTYLTVAAAIGMTKDDVDLAIKRIDKVLKKARKVLGQQPKQ